MKKYLFVQTNNLAGNQIQVYDRADDGALTLTETVDTGGVGGMNEGGEGDPLASQGSLIYNTHHRLLIAVNAGSDTVSVLSLDDGHLSLRQVLPSGGTFPVSVTVHNDLVYVVNAHDAGAIAGYRITYGQLHQIENSTRSLKLTPVTGPTQFANTPGQIGFTPNGKQLIITTKANGSFIDVFTIGHDGRPSNTFVANPAGTPIPFGFTFDGHGHLVTTDAGLSALSTYTVHANDTVKKIASQPDEGSQMCWVTHVAGNFYATDTASNNVTGYRIDPAGMPTVFTKTDTRKGPIDMAGTHDGNFLYVQVGFAGGIDGFHIKPDGTLDQVVTLTGIDGLDGIAIT